MKKLLVTGFILYILPAIIFAQPWSRAPVIKQNLIFPLQEKHVHASTIVSLPNGDFLAAWFYGKGERREDDVKIMGAKLKRGSDKWSEPFLMADTYGLPDCNPVLFINRKGKLFLVWIAVQANLWEQSILRFRTSVNYSGNGAPVWSWQDNILLKPDDRFATETAEKFKTLPDNTSGWAGYAPGYDDQIIEASKDKAKRSIGWMTRIHPVILETGRILLPLYSDGFNMSMMAISDDDGETWKPGLPLVGRGPIQPALAVKKNGDIVAFMRDSGNEPARVQKSISSDNGETWTTAQKTDIPNTASVEVCVLKNGKWAFIGNDIDDGRYRLSLYISDDEGMTWKWKVALENEEKNNGSFSYPCLIQTTDGLLHITYSYHKAEGKKSIKYVSLDPDKITK